MPNQGRNNAANRYGREGVFVSPSSRAFRDEEGKSFWVDIEIVDEHRYPSGLQAPYNVTVSLSRCLSISFYFFVLLLIDRPR